MAYRILNKFKYYLVNFNNKNCLIFFILLPLDHKCVTHNEKSRWRLQLSSKSVWCGLTSVVNCPISNLQPLVLRTEHLPLEHALFKSLSAYHCIHPSDTVTKYAVLNNSVTQNICDTDGFTDATVPPLSHYVLHAMKLLMSLEHREVLNK